MLFLPTEVAVLDTGIYRTYFSKLTFIDVDLEYYGLGIIFQLSIKGLCSFNHTFFRTAPFSHLVEQYYNSAHYYVEGNNWKISHETYWNRKIDE